MTGKAITGATRETSTPATVGFGAQLRLLRHRRQWSQQELGAAVFFSREYVALVERGLRAPTATFVERAEAALDADGQLRAVFELVERDRERAARRRAETRSMTPRHGKIYTAARQLRAAMCAASAGDRWAAFDELHRVLQAELTPIDADAGVKSLEQRYAGHARETGDARDWAAVASAAGQGLADAGALLKRPLHSDHVARLVAVAQRFAVLAGDALLMLGQPGRADAWYTLAETIQPRSATASSDERIWPAARVTPVEHDGGDPVQPGTAASLPRDDTTPVARRSVAIRPPTCRRPTRRRPCRMNQRGRQGRGPPGQCTMPSTSSSLAFGTSAGDSRSQIRLFEHVVRVVVLPRGRRCSRRPARAGS